MSKTIKAIERHLIMPVRLERQTKVLSVRSTDWTGWSGSGFELPSRDSTLVAEWQQRGPETLSGYASRKLRLAFAPAEAVITASATS
ncbi:MAG TPA: hypothetical protein VGI60_14085 [Chthoniobacterales bacterium]